jgi:hypothetical protein
VPTLAREKSRLVCRSRGGAAPRFAPLLRGAVSQREAADWLRQHHYLRTLAGRRWLYGLVDERAADSTSALVGVAVFGPSMPNALPALFPGLKPNEDSTELVRFGLLDSVAANGESWFLAAAFRHLAGEGVAAVVSFSDPVARWRADGQVVALGHIGTCYAASGATYTGRTSPVLYCLFPEDAALLHPRMIAKYRAGDPNAGSVERALVNHGARPREAAEDPRQYPDRILTTLTVPFRHGGLHRYAFTLGPHARAVRLSRPALPHPRRLG